MSSSSHNDVTQANGWRKPENTDHRSPCPALNALANEGHIPRSGTGITAAQLTSAMERYLGLVPGIGAKLAKAAIAKLGKPGTDSDVLDLADLRLHGFIEHDASLTRRDAREGDAATLAVPLLDQLLALSRDGKTITREDLAVAHQLRVAQSAAGSQRVSFKAQVLGTLEAALLFAVLSRDGVIALADLAAFLRDERIPEHLKPQRVGRGLLVRTAAAMAVIGNVPTFSAAKRARELARHPAP